MVSPLLLERFWTEPKENINITNSAQPQMLIYLNSIGTLSEPIFCQAT
jgi:hypothetical protein